MPASNVMCGGGCLGGDTLVPLFDGSQKLASEIVEGDLLLLYDANGSSLPERVFEIFGHRQPCIEVVHERGTLICSTTHRFVLTTGEDIDAMTLDCEEHQLLGEDGRPVSILSLKLVEPQRVYGWNCEPRHIFNCGGIIHHNKIPPGPNPPSSPPP